MCVCGGGGGGAELAENLPKIKNELEFDGATFTAVSFKRKT